MRDRRNDDNEDIDLILLRKLLSRLHFIRIIKEYSKKRIQECKAAQGAIVKRISIQIRDNQIQAE